MSSLCYEFTCKPFLLISCAITRGSGKPLLLYVPHPFLVHSASSQPPGSPWFAKIITRKWCFHSFLAAPEAAVGAGRGWLVLWIPSGALHRPSHSPVFSPLRVRACCRQHRCDTGGTTVNGQVGNTSCSSGSVRQCFITGRSDYGMLWREKKWIP